MKTKPLSHFVPVVLGILLLFVLSIAWLAPAQAVSPSIVISQVYGGGGNSGAPYRNDFVELFNRSATVVSLAGWSVQYTSATGTGLFSGFVTPLSGSLAPGQYYLIQMASGGSNGVPLPTPDLIGTTSMGATGGKVVLVNTTTGLACNGGSTPCTPSDIAKIIDLVGYGNANFYEGSGAAPAPSNTTSDLRASNGCTDTDVNSSDFATGAPNPRNTSSPLNVCGDLAPAIFQRSPVNNETNVAIDANIVITFTEPVNVSSGWYTISCTTSGAHTATVTGGPTTFTLDPTTNFTINETCTVTVVGSQVSDQDTNDPPDTMSPNSSWSFSTLASSLRIRDIQGSTHISPFNGQAVASVAGIVTAVRTTGFYMQDPSPDSDDATSEGIFVYTASAPTVNVGDSVLVSGTVSEYRPGGEATNLTITEITSPSVTVQSSGNPLPAAIVVGTGGRIPPNTIIEDDSAGDVETSNTFDPATDGIDFWESLEGMRVQINNARAVGPSRYYASSNSWEIPVVGDNGANANVLTVRGGVLVRSTDYNPERILLADALATLPGNMNVGDGFTAAIVGVIDYSYGNYKLYPTTAPTRVNNGLTQETTTAQTGAQFSVATFNVENLDPNDSDGDTDVASGKFTGLANLIVNNLRSPDILSIEEIQDNDGSSNTTVVDASTTWTMLINAITSAGGPTYQYRQIDPVDDQDGGQTGGNIRQGFLYRADRGLAFVDRAGAGSTTANAVINNGGVPQLQYSPGRIDPTNAAFSASRKPLAGEFTFNGNTLFVIVNHWNSKSGDQPLFGRYQPPTLTSETQRNQQATLVGNFVASILAIDSNAAVIVMGDLNDFEFSTPLTTVRNLGSLSEENQFLPQNEWYTYTYEGNSQMLDHILVSQRLAARRVRVDVVHVNAEFATRLSDHEPVVAVYDFNAPTAVTLSSFTATVRAPAVGLLGLLLGGAGAGLMWLVWRRQWRRAAKRE